MRVITVNGRETHTPLETIDYTAAVRLSSMPFRDDYTVICERGAGPWAHHCILDYIGGDAVQVRRGLIITVSS